MATLSFGRRSEFWRRVVGVAARFYEYSSGGCIVHLKMVKVVHFSTFSYTCFATIITKQYL